MMTDPDIKERRSLSADSSDDRSSLEGTCQLIVFLDLVMVFILTLALVVFCLGVAKGAF